MKLSILFVDDDINILNGLKRMMYPMKKDWDLYFVGGGKEALELLKQNPVDVIISDIRMPGIDGTQLLTQIKDNYPHIIRITLSGFANDNLAIRNTRIVHQSLSKPTTNDQIKDVIEKAYKLREKINNKELLSIINSIENLPSIPKIYEQLEEEINSQSSSIDRLSKIISNDPLLTAKILQLTNSAFFGLPTHISNIAQALNYLGIKLIQNLVLSVKLFRPIDNHDPKSNKYLQIWNHSNRVALFARELAKIEKLNQVEIDECYLGGLLHDIGKLVLLANEENLYKNLNLQYGEIETLTTTRHADIGGYLLGLWGLPDTIVEAAAYHHSEDFLHTKKINPSKIVYLANLISKHDQYTPANLHQIDLGQFLDNYKLISKEQG